MNNKEKYLAHILFKVRVLTSEGQDFENLFIAIMQSANLNFRPVKPQGKFGDRKNDGFDKETGTYYQIYAPENSSKSSNTAINKLKADFEGLYSYWNEQVTPIKEFFFVLNDKYKGGYPTLEVELAKIEKKYKIKANPYIIKNLEDLLFELPEEKINGIIGLTPDAVSINDIDFGSMNEVINHLTSIKFSYTLEHIPYNPDFEKKILFNNLSDIVASWLKQGNYQNHIIKNYFKRNRSGLKNDLREIFSKLYSDGLKLVGNNKENDTVFLYILTNASPQLKKHIQDAVLVLMSYYFEYCDIFKTPKKEKKT